MQQTIALRLRKAIASVLVLALAVSLIPIRSVSFAVEPSQGGHDGEAPAEGAGYPIDAEHIDDAPNPLADGGLQATSYADAESWSPIRMSGIVSSEGRVYKDVTAVKLYTLVDGVAEGVDTAPVDNFDDYLAYVELADAPSFYADVTDASEDGLVLADPLGDSLTVPFPLMGAEGEAPSFVESLKSESGYEASHAIAYANAIKASPFAPARQIIDTGNGFSGILASQLLRCIIAFDEDGVVVSCKDAVPVSAKLVFDDYTVMEGSISEGILTVTDQKVPYEFCGYAIGSDNSAAAKLKTHIESYGYMDYLGKLLGARTDNRVQRDYWEDTVQPNAAAVARDILANTDQLAATAPDNPVYAAMLDQALGTEGDAGTLKMLPILYAYNYIQRWYDFDIEGLRVADLLLYAGDFYSRNCTLDNFAARFAASTPAQRLGENNQIGYAQLIYPCLREDEAIANVKLFVENLVDVFTGFECADDWFVDAYNKTGVIVEMEPWEEGYSWRAWQNLSKNGTGPDVQNGTKRILPFLTLPDYSYYAFSLPSIFSYGSPYMYYSDPSQNQEALRQRILKSKPYYLNYLKTLLGFTGRKAAMNSMLVLDQDKQCVAPHSNWHSWLGENGVTEAEATQDPMFKGFYEVLKLPPPTMGSAACGGDETVRWRSSSKLDDFSVWTHEMGHCLEQPILLSGGAAKGGAEDCTFGCLEQGLSENCFGLNLAYDTGYEGACAFNSSCKRIETPQKAQSFWKGVFEAIDLLDYIELKAFLRLDTEEQRAVSSQLWYSGGTGSRMGGDTGYTSFALYDPASVSRFASENQAYVSDEAKGDIEREGSAVVHMDTVDDVFDHRVVLYPGIASGDHVEFAPRAHGCDSILNRWWYTPHYDRGGTESATRKSLCFRMFGEDGYRGYQLMASGMPDDTAALTASTGKSSFKQYKIDKYNEIERRLGGLSCIDADELEDEYYDALRAAAATGDRNLSDANSLRTQSYYMLKRITRDFEESVYDSAKVAETSTGSHPSDANAVVRDGSVPVATVDDFLAMGNDPAGSYRITADIDFSGLDTSDFGGALIRGDFTGVLDGGGFTLSGLEGAALFSRFCGKAKDMKIHSFTYRQPEGDGVAAFAKRMDGAALDNIEFADIVLSGLDRTAVLAGWDEGASALNRISVANSEVTAGDAGRYNSLLVGRKNGGSIEDASVQGRLVCQGAQNGGVCGSAKGVAFSHVIADVDITRLPSDRESGNRSAGFLGDFDGVGVCRLSDCLFTGTVTGDAYGFSAVADSQKGSFRNCYELQSSGGIPAADGVNIIAYQREDAAVVDFWEGLGFPMGLWSYATLADGHLALVYGGDAWDIEASIDYVGESLTFRGADSDGIAIEGVGSPDAGVAAVSLTAALDTPGWDHTVTVTKTDDGTHGVDYKRVITIPARPDGPALAVAPPADDDPKTRGTITFPAGRTYQIRILDSGSPWSTISPSGLGDTVPMRPSIMEVRHPAVAGQSFASKTALADLRYRDDGPVGKYKLSLDARGGRLSTIPTEYVAGSPVTLPLPMRTGYAFAGWYDNDRFEGSPVTQIDATARGDKAFYARWLSVDTTVDSVALRGVPAVLGDDGVFSITLPAGSELPRVWGEFTVTALEGTSISGTTNDDGATWTMTVLAPDGATEGSYVVRVRAADPSRGDWDIRPVFDFQNETLVIGGSDASGIAVEGVADDAVAVGPDGQSVVVSLGDRLDDRGWDHVIRLAKTDGEGFHRGDYERRISVPRRPAAPDPQTERAGFRSGLGSIALTGEAWEYRSGSDGVWHRADNPIAVNPGEYEIRSIAKPNSFASQRVAVIIADAPDPADAIAESLEGFGVAIAADPWVIPASAAVPGPSLGSLIDAKVGSAMARAVAGSALRPDEVTYSYGIEDYRTPVDGDEDNPSGIDGGFNLVITLAGEVDAGVQGFSILGLLQPRAETYAVIREVSIPVVIAAPSYTGVAAAKSGDWGGRSSGLSVEPDPEPNPEPQAGAVSLLPCGVVPEAGPLMRLDPAGPEVAMQDPLASIAQNRPQAMVYWEAGNAAAPYRGFPWFALPVLALAAAALMGGIGAAAFLLHKRKRGKA